MISLYLKIFSLFLLLHYIPTAGHSKVYDSRLDPSHIDYRSGTSKLDVHQRNTYNRTNHNRYQTEQYRQSSSSSSSSHHLLPQVVVHRTDSSSSTSAAPLPYAASAGGSSSSHTTTSTSGGAGSSGSTSAAAAAAAAASADNNNHSQYSALHNSHNQIGRYAQEQPDPYWDDTADSRRFTERRKKTVRFDGQDSDDWTRWDAERQGSQDSATKDSGIDTSSTFTSSEDSNRGDGPKVFCYISFL